MTRDRVAGLGDSPAGLRPRVESLLTLSKLWLSSSDADLSRRCGIVVSFGVVGDQKDGNGDWDRARSVPTGRHVVEKPSLQTAGCVILCRPRFASGSSCPEP